MQEFYTWAILLINQLDEIEEKQQFLAQEGAKIAPYCTYPFRIPISNSTRDMLPT